MDNEKVETITDDPKEKRIKELEAELGKRAEEIGTQKKFIEDANTVLNTIYYNPELKKQFQDAYAKAYGLPAEQPEEKPSEEKPSNNDAKPVEEFVKKVDDVELSQREQVVREFEKSMGLDRLDKEEAKKVKSEIAGFLGEFGHTIKSIPLSSLNKTLEKAYTAVRAEKMREEGRMEGFTKMRENDSGAMPSFSSGEIPEPSDKTLSKDQAEWVKKLGGNLEKAEKMLKDNPNPKE